MLPGMAPEHPDTPAAGHPDHAPGSGRAADGPALREFHVSRTARDRHGIDAALFRTDGQVVLADPSAARRLAASLERARAGAGRPPVEAGELFAMGLIHEILHYVVGLYRREVDPGAFGGALAAVDAAVGPAEVDAVLDAFRERFPTAAAYRGDPGAIPLDRAAALEEVALLWLENVNPAFEPFRELFDDRDLATSTSYERVIGALGAYFAGRPPFGPDGQPLVAMLRSPALAVPDSIPGQLGYIRERWASLLGELLGRLLLGMDVLDEEARGRWMRFHPWSGGAGAATSAALAGFGGAEEEPERFSTDKVWMPNVVLMAKSTYVWLDQLSRRLGRDIRTLDAIPDEELDTLARWGVNGLWLIGLWQRSRASERIKRMRGNPEAVASAYSLDDYRIADDLGGEAAWAGLRERAWRRGIRLASDMVPNHMGIDSRWVIEHPERFLSLAHPPYPGYSFGGPDLSDDARVAIRIEDHYWDGMDAAVVFQRVDRATGDVRYIYHGNDGTSFPWNDTAQLDYLQASVREAVIQAILDVARRFPIIRFDAAMTLAKKHIERLWYPVPGQGGAIPSRAEHALSREAFDAAMPVEFWREVVDRVAVEAPDTLLLAEAFWLMEGYFVRTLGMHRVYNSAFMHMLRDEDNAGYRSVMKNTLEFDPEVLKRYVNFMNNPDEKTAVEQFGKGDKYFGVATLLATLPGLPMLGHGQIEGFAEKYGMEYRRAYLDEQPDGWLVERHERELFPLLHRRRQFAEVEGFQLYDLFRDGGSVDEDVYAYSNGQGRERSLVVYHNRFASTAGWLRQSVAFSEPDGAGGRRLVRRTLGEGWGLPRDPAILVRFRDHVSGLEHLHRANDVHERGLYVELPAYGRHVFVDVAEVRDGSAGLWGRLADRLAGRGVASLDASLRELELEPVHAALRRVFADGVLSGLVAPAITPAIASPPAVAGRAASDDGARVTSRRRAGKPTASVTDAPAAGAGPARPDGAALDELERRLSGFLAALAESTGTAGPAAEIARAGRDRLAAILDLRTARAAGPVLQGAMDRAWGDPAARAALVGWALLSRIGALAPGAPVEAISRAWLDELRLGPVLAEGFRSLGLDEGAAWAAAERVPLLVTLPRAAGQGGPARSRAGRLIDAWLAHPDVRPFIRVNRWEGVEWFAKESFESLLDDAVVLDAADPATSADAERSAAVASELRSAAAVAGYRVDELRRIATPPAPAARRRGR